jgi:hypothetical protein
MTEPSRTPGITKVDVVEPKIPYIDGGDDLVRAEPSVTFDWQPDAGSAGSRYDFVEYWFMYESWEYAGTFHSSAAGQVTFTNVSSSAPFDSQPTDLHFQPTGFAADWNSPQGGGGSGICQRGRGTH